MKRTTGALLADLSTFIISRLMRNVSAINCRENQNTRFMLIKFLQKTGKIRYSPQDTDDNIIRHIRFACWINKATDTTSEYVILIAFPRKKMVTRTRVTVAFICKLPVFSVF